MTTDELLALVAAGMAHVTGRPAPALNLDADIDTLGLDSLQTLELVAWPKNGCRSACRTKNSPGSAASAISRRPWPPGFRLARHDQPGPA
jgi:Phosphopantetheine attachment site